MKKRVLFIGGSRFVGRVFHILAARDGGFELHAVNRGNFPLNLGEVAEYKCDRRSGRMMARLLPEGGFDACIDTCARAAGDVRIITDALGDRIRQYIFFSSADVYDPLLRKVRAESDPLPPPESARSAAARAAILLENELKESCEREGIPHTVLRPAYIYGPLNYLPRESWFIESIARRHVVPVPLDATASFSLVYVKDVARALMTMIGDPRAYGETFNLAAPERMNHTRMISDFERLNGGSFDTREATVAEIYAENVPMPFPMTDDELTDGEKLTKTFDFQYTPFAEGMEATFVAVSSLYSRADGGDARE